MTSGEVFGALFDFALIGLLFRWWRHWSWLEFLWYLALAFAFTIAMTALDVPFLGQ